jgi:hypothetical protein
VFTCGARILSNWPLFCLYPKKTDSVEGRYLFWIWGYINSGVHGNRLSPAVCTCILKFAN